MKFEIQPLINACQSIESGSMSLEEIRRGTVSCADSPKYALTRKGRNTVEIVDVGTNEIVSIIENVWWVVKGWADDILICAFYNKMVSVRSLATKQDIFSVGPLTDVAFDSDRERMVGINAEGEAVLYDLKSLEKIGTFTSDKGPLKSVQYSPSGKYVIATVNTSGYALDRDTLHYVRRIDYHGRIWSLDISPDKRFALINHNLYSIENGGRRPIELTISDEEKAGKVNRERNYETYEYDEWDYSVREQLKAFSFSPDSKYLAIVADVESSEYNLRDGRYFTGSHSKIFVFNARTLKELCILDDRVQGARNDYTDVVFSPDGQYLVARRPDAIKMWRSGTWELCAELWGNNRGVAFSRDGKYLVIEQ